MIPSRLFLTRGVGRHRERLPAFELALRDAGIAHVNLVNVSSIVPPGCKLVPREKGLSLLRSGEITHVVLARNETDEPHRLLSASIGLAIPSRPDAYGYISEHHAYGQTEEAAGSYAEELAATMLATRLGMAFDPEAPWEGNKAFFHDSMFRIRTTHTTHSATGSKEGSWTSVIAAAVLLP